MLPAIGQKFGPYEILALLGGGGMGVVFRAWDERLHREVAIKLLHDQYRAPGMRERFLLEARAASALAHPHICTIFDIGQQDGEPYLVMELLKGSTLKQVISQRACSADEIVRYGEQMADALSAAHAKGIVHRDVKPANVILQSMPGGESAVKILDFGLAKVSMALRSGRDSRALELTSAGFTVGTLAYMSPEQARGEALDARTDLFSLGALMYEMATRRTPFRAATTALAFQALLGEPPDPIRKWNVTVPRELERIVTRLLQKERGRRFPDAVAVREELAKLLARGGGEWLRRLPAAVVPLVATADPVARHPRASLSKPKQAPLAENTLPVPVDSSGSLPAAPVKPSVEVEGVLRPWRLPVQEKTVKEKVPEERPIAAAAQGMAGEMLPASRSLPLEAAAGALPVEQISSSESGNASHPALAVRESAAEVRRSEIVAVKSRTGVNAAGAVAAQYGEEDASAAPEQGVAAPWLVLPEATDAGRTLPVKVAPAMPIITDPSFRRPQRAKISSTRLPVARPAEETSTPAQMEPTAAESVAGQNETVAPNASARRAGRTRLTQIAAVLAVCAAVAMLVVELRSGSLGTVVLGPNGSVLLGPVANRTGDASLDGVVLEGLRISLAERSQPRWLGADALVAGTALVSREQHLLPTRVQAHNVAQRLGARAYIAGEITGRRGQETIRLDVIEASSNDRLGSVSETVTDSRDLLGVIAHLADTLRAKVGDTRAAPRGSHVLASAISSSGGVAALSAFAQGEAARSTGDLLGAAMHYREAVALAPQFALAHLRLAWIYEREGAELGAAESAGRAFTTASREVGPVQPMARTAAQLLREGDPAAALSTMRRAVSQWPENAELLTLLARVTRSNGHMTEALLAAEKALSHDPYNGDAYREAALALIGQNRGADALRMAQRAREHGTVCDCDQLLAQDLLRGEDNAAPVSPAADTSNEARVGDDLVAARERALVLDDEGDFSRGLVQWRDGARKAQAEPQMISAAAGMLATAASDRALAGRCAEAVALAHDASLLAYGPSAAFHIALSGAFCPATGGSEMRVAQARLEAGAKAGAPPIAQMVPLLHTAQALAAHQPDHAVAAISLIAAEHDTQPLVAYLRGTSLMQSGQRSAAAIALEQAAANHGYALLTEVIVSPLARNRLRHP